MKKALLTFALIGLFGIVNTAANAAQVTVTKPTIKVNTTKEETTLSKKINDAKQIQTATKNNINNSKADYKAKQAAQKEQANKAKDEFSSRIKQDIEKTKADIKTQQDQAYKESQEKKKQRQDAIKSFKDTLK